MHTQHTTFREFGSAILPCYMTAWTMGGGGEGGIALHNGGMQQFQYHPNKKFLRRRWRAVFPVLFCQNDGGGLQGGGGVGTTQQSAVLVGGWHTQRTFC